MGEYIIVAVHRGTEEADNVTVVRCRSRETANAICVFIDGESTVGTTVEIFHDPGAK